MADSLDQLRTELAADFRTYLAFVLEYQGFKPSKCQLEMADHLQCGAPTIGLFACRGSSKTTIASTHYINWRHLRCPDMRVLIASGVDERAGALAKQLSYNYRNFPWLMHLSAERFGSERHFNLSGARREPTNSVNSLSVFGKATGLRADLVVLDDPQMTADTSDVLFEELLRQIDDYTNVLRAPDTQPWFRPNMPRDCAEFTQMVVIGTYQDVINDIYTPPEDPTVPHFMRGAKVKSWPAIVRDDDNPDARVIMNVSGDAPDKDYNGKWRSNFPEILPIDYLLEKKSKMSKAQWALQYMLDKTAVPGPEDAILDMRKISQFAYEKPDVVKDIKNWYIVCDPADKGGDYWVSIECAPYCGKLYIRSIDAWTKTDSAICIERTIEKMLRNGDVKKVYYESSFSAMGSLFRAKLNDLGQRTIALEAINNRSNKVARIVNALEPSLNTGRMVLRKDLTLRRDVRLQLEGLRQAATPKPHDDIVDCLAFCWVAFEQKLQMSGRASVTQYVV